jgi:hypothetical protein
MREVLHALLLTDVLLLQPSGLAYAQLDISRRRRYGSVREVYEQRLREAKADGNPTYQEQLDIAVERVRCHIIV